jgi:uncharacterized protein YjbJ (UPF0337 family)
MDRDRNESGWEDLKDKAKETWGKVTGDLGRVAAEAKDRAVGAFGSRAADVRDRAEMFGERLRYAAALPRHRNAPGPAEVLALVGLGAGLMYFLDPDRGRRRCALARDQFVHALHEIDDAIGVVSRDVRNRSRGKWARIRTLPGRMAGEEVPDEVLVERVRSKMGRSVSHPRPIEVTARRGRVTLSGPILAHEVGPLMSAVASVPGVVDVEDRLEVHEEPGDIPQLQGGRIRGGERAELWQANWSPTARLLVGTAGTALLGSGASRRGLGGLALGALGTALLARAVTNIPCRDWLGAGGEAREADSGRRPSTADTPPTRVGRAQAWTAPAWSSGP